MYREEVLEETNEEEISVEEVRTSIVRLKSKKAPCVWYNRWDDQGRRRSNCQMDAQYCEHGLEDMNCTRGLEEGSSHPCAQVGK